MLKDLTPTKKGLVTGLVMVALSLFFYYVLKMPVNQKEQYALFSVYIAGIIWSLYEFRQTAADKNFKSFFSTGFKTFIVATLLMVLYTLFSLNSTRITGKRASQKTMRCCCSRAIIPRQKYKRMQTS